MRLAVSPWPGFSRVIFWLIVSATRRAPRTPPAAIATATSTRPTFGCSRLPGQEQGDHLGRVVEPAGEADGPAAQVVQPVQHRPDARPRPWPLRTASGTRPIVATSMLAPSGRASACRPAGRSTSSRTPATQTHVWLVTPVARRSPRNERVEQDRQHQRRDRGEQQREDELRAQGTEPDVASGRQQPRPDQPAGQGVGGGDGHPDAGGDQHRPGRPQADRQEEPRPGSSTASGTSPFPLKVSIEPLRQQQGTAASRRGW